MKNLIVNGTRTAREIIIEDLIRKEEEAIRNKNNPVVTPPVNSPVFTPTSSGINNPKSYLILPGKQHGDYSYPDLLVQTTRLGYDPEVENIAKKLNLTLSDTGTENNGSGFIGNINWSTALKLNLSLDSFTLNPRQYLDFLALLKFGNAFYADGKKADKDVLDNILDEIITKRNPYRAEWLDADFKVIKGKGLFGSKSLFINYNHKLVGNDLAPEKSELLEECLMEDKTPGIDLDNLLINSTKQGLPKKNISSGSLYYWYPRSDNNSVAMFNADSDRTWLYCDGYPSSSDGGLGVRRAKIFP